MSEKQDSAASANEANMARSSLPTRPTNPSAPLDYEFRAHLSEQLRTPLNTVIGFAELLAMQPGGGAKNDSAEHILRASRELLAIIDRELGEPDLTPSAREAGSPSRSSSHVLYIEDDSVNFALVQSILKRRPDLQLLHATHGEIGVTLAQTHVPQLILLDLNLPDIHGAEVLRRLRQDKSTSQIPVVVISADATPSQIERLLTAGARDYLTKPFEIPNFLAVIDGLVEEEAARRG